NCVPAVRPKLLVLPVTAVPPATMSHEVVSSLGASLVSSAGAGCASVLPETKRAKRKNGNERRTNSSQGESLRRDLAAPSRMCLNYGVLSSWRRGTYNTSPPVSARNPSRLRVSKPSSASPLPRWLVEAKTKPLGPSTRLGGRLTPSAAR